MDTNEVIDLPDVVNWVTRYFFKHKQSQILTTQIDAERRLVKLFVSAPIDPVRPHPYVYVKDGLSGDGQTVLPLLEVLYVKEEVSSYELLLKSFSDNRLPHTTVNRFVHVLKLDTLADEVGRKIHDHLVSR